MTTTVGGRPPYGSCSSSGDMGALESDRGGDGDRARGCAPDCAKSVFKRPSGAGGGIDGDVDDDAAADGGLGDGGTDGGKGDGPRDGGALPYGSSAGAAVPAVDGAVEVLVGRFLRRLFASVLRRVPLAVSLASGNGGRPNGTNVGRASNAAADGDGSAAFVGVPYGSLAAVVPMGANERPPRNGGKPACWGIDDGGPYGSLMLLHSHAMVSSKQSETLDSKRF